MGVYDVFELHRRAEFVPVFSKSIVLKQPTQKKADYKEAGEPF